MISDEVAEVTARRIAAKLADLTAIRLSLGGEVDDLAVGERLDAAALGELERRLGVTVPAAYRALATHVGTAGAGPDGGLLGAGLPLPSSDEPAPPDAVTARSDRPFLLTEAWHPLSDDGAPRPPPFADAHPDAAVLDGVMPLTDLGDGSFAFLVLSGPRAGDVWEDRTAEGGPLSPVEPLLSWYERWLDELLVDGLMEAMRRAMPPGQISPVHEQLERWGPLLDERATAADATAADLAAQALWKLAQGRMAEADALIARLERRAAGADGDALAVPDGAPEGWLEDMLESLTLWSLADEAAAALDRYPPGERLMVHRAWRLRRLLAHNPHTPALALSWLAGDGRLEVRCAVATNPGASAKVLREALTAATTLWQARVDHLEALFVLDLLARHPGWPAEQLATFAGWAAAWPQHHTAPWVARAVAYNPAAGPALLATLAGHAHPCVRQAAAARHDLPADALAALVGDPDPCVREACVAHPSLTTAALAALAADPVERVRYRVAQRPSLPEALQLRLAGDLTTSVLLALGERDQLAPAAAELLALRPPVVLPGEADELVHDGPYHAELREDDDAAGEANGAPAHPLDPTTGLPPLVAAIAPGWPHRPAMPDDSALEGVPGAALVTLVTARALAHPGYPSALLAAEAAAAAQPHDVEAVDLVGRAIADHPWPTGATLRDLARASYVPTRARVATRPELDRDAVALLLDDPAPMVQRRLAERGDRVVPAETLERWATLPQAETRAAAAAGAAASPALLRRLAVDPEPFVRRAVAQNPSAPAALLIELAADPDPAVRCALTWRLEVAPAVLERLLGDADRDVEAWARWRRARDRALAG